jgi:hypothetical protein
MDVITQVEIPVYFFTGRHDYTDPFTLTEQYIAKINAPEKRMVWFEASAHFPFYEEPAAFAWQMRDVLNATKVTDRGLSRQMERFDPGHKVGQEVTGSVHDNQHSEILRSHPQNAEEETGKRGQHD